MIIVLFARGMGCFRPKLESVPYGLLSVSAHPGNVCGPYDRYAGNLSFYILCYDQYFVADTRK